MHKIKIDENARIIIEDLNYTLEYRVPKGDFQGKKGIGFKWQVGGYFPDLVSLAQDYVLNAPSKQKSSINTLQELRQTIKEAENKIVSLLKLKLNEKITSTEKGGSTKKMRQAR